MAKKLKKFLKKAAPLLAAGLGAAALAKRKRHLGVRDSDDAGRGVKWFGHRMDDIPFADPTTVNPNFLALGAKHGGRIGAKGGGIAKRGMGAAFKKGGHVKSMGIAKRGGGVAKR